MAHSKIYLISRCRSNFDEKLSAQDAIAITPKRDRNFKTRHRSSAHLYQIRQDKILTKIFKTLLERRFTGDCVLGLGFN